MKACIAIPTISAFKTLKPLVNGLADDPAVGRILILDNGHRSTQARSWFRNVQRRSPKVEVVDTKGWGIHRMWNYGWQYAREQGFEFFGALNDDIVAPRDLVRDLVDALDRNRDLWIVSPDWHRRLDQGHDVTGRVRRVTGTQRHGGIAGWCWVLRADIPVPPIDENLQWWYGDCDLAEQIRLAGGALGVVEGLPLDHDQETTARKHPWTRQAIIEDGRYFESKYGSGSAIPYRVSVLIPTMNRPERLRRAVACVLRQDYPSFEVIVQNGGESLTPLTEPHDPLRDDRVRVREARDTGICNALNRAAEVAIGDVWHMCCDDDEMQAGALWSAASALRTGEQWTYGWMRQFREMPSGRRRQVALHTARLWRWNLNEHKAANSINQPTAFWARESYEKHGPFNEDFPMIWDYEWWMRLGVRYTPVARDHCDADYVIWPGSTSVHAAEEMAHEVARLQELWARVGYGER